MSGGTEKIIRLLDIKLDKLKVKKKSEEDLETQEGVLDKFTLETLYYLAKRNLLTEMHGVISAGKESNIYWAKNNDVDYAVKIYRTSTANFKAIQNYIKGDPRFKKIRKGIRPLIYAWALKEFKNLQRASAAGVRVPKPVAVKNNVLIMEFIGCEGKPAPLLKNVVLESPENIYKIICDYIIKLYKDAELVHADLSEFNIMYPGEPVIIDMSQSVLTSHPLALDYLKRDISVTFKFFRELGVDVMDENDFLNQVTGGV
ncbi:MAG: serine protein kinase RIO [Candidatus Odinarchaeum yellowstonii]|jgi:RIO kinase 1|uniref:non-specific serine/threonine protein kinase n=1 Tax=Odinarchaeota yellowstonii (strain LCB_4) TaxID=1841599 RepID=A0AAF0D360_ODILC|nr:MAG: serine protein kinase RIO [Candidatus Odinarchaeum yellowstonii]